VEDRYREVYRSFRWQVPPDFNIARYACARWARDERRALIWEDESGSTVSMTYAGLQEAVNRLSNALAAKGIARGDRVHRLQHGASPHSPIIAQASRLEARILRKVGEP